MNGLDQQVYGFLLALAAGLATCIGGLCIFSQHLIYLAKPRTLAIAMALSCGVMLFISLVEIFGEAVTKFEQAQNKGEGITECGHRCKGHAWTLSTVVFLGGVGIVYLLEYLTSMFCPEENTLLPEQLEELVNCYNAKSAVAPTNLTTGGQNHMLQETQLESMKRRLRDECSSRQKLGRTGLITALAIGFHNIPEGIATYVSAVESTQFGAALGLGIALHNIPEGVAVACPIYFATGSRWKGFLWTLVAAIAEPVGALMAYTMIGDSMDGYVAGILFACVAGMMVCISLKELLPTAKLYAPEGNLVDGCIFLGMLLMSLSFILFSYAGIDD